MANTGDMLRHIGTMLAQLSADAVTSAAAGRTDRAKELERVVAQLFDIIFDGHFANRNSDGPTYPAIDLGDAENRIAVQVTVRTDREKVQSALDDFLKHDLDRDFDRLIVVMFVEKVEFRSEIVANERYSGKRFHFRKRNDVWDLRKLNREIEDLEDGQIEQIYQYLARQTGRTERPRPAYLLPALPSMKTSFVPGSRDGELKALMEIVSSGEPAFIWGLGGMGKTLVAMELGKLLQPTRDVYFLHYVQTMRETILRANFSGYKYDKPDNENRDGEFRARMDMLRRDYAGSVLIIDNFDRPGSTLAQLQAEDAYRELTQCGLTLVFTTRSEAPGVRICPLDEDTLLGLIRQSYKSDPGEDGALRKLIRAVDGHTMMVDLLGKTLGRSRGGVTVAQLLDAFRGGLDSQSMPEIGSDHNQSAGQQRIYDHLKILFDVSVLSKGQREILRYASLLPEDGLDYQTFRRTLDDPLKPRLDDLVDSGWLQYREKRLMIHPVIREVCLVELKPKDENCREFLNMLWDLYDFDTFYDAGIFLQLAQCFSSASERLDDREGDWALFADRYWNLVGQPQMALTYGLQMLNRREQNLPDSLDLATAYNNLAVSYGALGDNEKALEYGLKALSIRERKLSPDHPALVLSYSNVAYSYGELGDHKTQLEFNLKALAIRKQKLSSEPLPLARAYNNVAETYGVLGNHKKRLEYHLEALAIWEQKLPPDHPNLALSYSNIAVTYGDLGDYEKRLEYNLKALTIREQRLPPDHTDLATSYNNLAEAYGALGDQEKRLEYHLKSLGILENKLPPDHPSLALSFGNVGTTYGTLGDHKKRLEYNLKALNILEKKLPPDHPTLATSYNNIGVTNYFLGDYIGALDYLEKALRIREKKLPPGHPYTEDTRENIAAVKEKLCAV